MIELPIAGTHERYRISPSKIIALGFNYMDHVREEGDVLKSVTPEQEKPAEPILFPKTPNTLIASGDSIIIPSFLKEYHFDEPRVDYEAELALIIARTAKNISEADALDYVYGYTCMNDVSQRNLQRADKSGWFRGKSLDSFGPIGPAVVRAEDIGDPQNLDIRCRLNGKVVQESNTSMMIFSIRHMLAFISKQITLEPGDIVVTGTPRGVGPLKDGDVVEVEIEGIGVLRNPVEEEQEEFRVSSS